jgi:hypothetical protein
MRHSFFVQNDGDGKVHELCMYHVTRMFPFPHKYIPVELENGVMGYLPLNVVGSDYDSGFRYMDDDGTVYQICSKTAVDVFREMVHANNLVVLCRNILDLYRAFRIVFEERVTIADDRSYVELQCPHAACGVSRMLLVGAYMGVAVDDTSLVTYFNGLNMSAAGGDKSFMGRTMMIGLCQPHDYRFFLEGGDIQATIDRRLTRLEGMFAKVAGAAPAETSDDLPSLTARMERLFTAFNDDPPTDSDQLRALSLGVAMLERRWATMRGLNVADYEAMCGVEFGFPAVNAVIIGRDVEKLPETSASYESLLKLSHTVFAAYDVNGGIIRQAAFSQTAADDVAFVRNNMLDYPGSHKTYNYFVLDETGRYAAG